MPLNNGATNQILPFATDGLEAEGDLMTLAEYQKSQLRLRGHQPGIAQRGLENRALRQALLMSTGTAQFIANRYTAGVKDNGDVDAVEAGLLAAVKKIVADNAPDLSGVVPTARKLKATAPMQVNGKAEAVLDGDVVFSVKVASETEAGVSERATAAEALAGEDKERFLTPATQHRSKYFGAQSTLNNATPSGARLYIADTLKTLTLAADIEIGKKFVVFWGPSGVYSIVPPADTMIYVRGGSWSTNAAGVAVSLDVPGSGILYKVGATAWHLDVTPYTNRISYLASQTIITNDTASGAHFHSANTATITLNDDVEVGKYFFVMGDGVTTFQPGPNSIVQIRGGQIITGAAGSPVTMPVSGYWGVLIRITSGFWRLLYTPNTDSKILERIATDAETQAGTLATKVVSPAGLLSAFDRSLTSSGYQKLPGGLIIQWGVVNVVPAVITFPTAFVSAVWGIVCSDNNVSESDGVIYACGAAGPSKDGFTLRSAGSAGSARWIAIGR